MSLKIDRFGLKNALMADVCDTLKDSQILRIRWITD